MSPESEQKLAKIYEVLMGDPINGKLGYFHTHNQIMEDMYGKGVVNLYIINNHEV